MINVNEKIKTIELESWKAIQDEFNQFTPLNIGDNHYERLKDYIIFKGHKNCKWKLSSTLERKNLEDSFDDIQFEFNQKASLFQGYDENLNKLDKLSLMRHYGVPSPLVDFTFSPYIALFFVFRDFLNMDHEAIKKHEFEKEYGAVFSLNYYQLNKLNDEKNGEKHEKYSAKEFKEFYKNSISGVKAFLPKNYNARINSQQGMFLCKAKNSSKTFNQEILDVAQNVSLVKYKIPHKLCCQILYELNKMNINCSSMFPDLSGLGEHVGFNEKLRHLNYSLNFS